MTAATFKVPQIGNDFWKNEETNNHQTPRDELHYPICLLYLCDEAVQQVVTSASLCYTCFIYIQINGFFSSVLFFCHDLSSDLASGEIQMTVLYRYLLP